MNSINVKSEINTLKKVLLHRPGKELLNITPNNLKELLFDDIPYLKIAQEEHDAFAKILKDNGVEVVYLEDLMTEVLDSNPELRRPFIKQFINEGNVNSQYYVDLLLSYFDTKYTNNKDLVLKLIEGVRLNEFPKEKAITLEDYISDYDSELVLDPLPNLYFQRDPFASIGNGVSIHKMYSKTRSRETIFAEYIFKYHKDYKDTKKYFDRYCEDSIEGGDILNLSKEVLAVGISQRTHPDSLEILANNIFNDPDSTIKEIYGFTIPKSRAFMHLDTVFTQIDYDKFTVHPAIVGPMRVFKLTNGEGKINIKEINDNLDSILAKILKLDRVQLLPCGGGDLIAAQREQWNDGSNTLCIAPGKVIAYQRNEITNVYLRTHGIEVIEMPSCELSRGRGGPRCMSMPLFRED